MDDEFNLTSLPYPYYAIPPPTQQPTNGELFLSLLHLICLTSILCGNVSQIVLQLYTHRLRDTTHVQHFLAFFFIINAFVSLGTPWMIVETLVRHWTFGTYTCKSYQATAQIGKTLLPYIIVALYFITGLSICPPRKCRMRQVCTAIIFSMIFTLLFLFIIIPVIGSSSLKSKIQGNPTSGDVFSVMFESFSCVVPFSEQVYTNEVAIIVEVIFPIIICIIMAIRLKMTTKDVPSVMSIGPINQYLLIISIIHFSTSFWQYLSFEKRESIFGFLPEPLNQRDILCLLPYISSSLTWYPASDLSTLWSVYESRSESPESGQSRHSSRQIRLLVPPVSHNYDDGYHNCHMPLTPKITGEV